MTIKLALAGTQEFIERCRIQAAKTTEITILHVMTEAPTAVEILEEDIDALVTGFDETKNRLILEAACRKAVKAIRFVSVPDYKEQLKWIPLRATCLLRGREIEGIGKYFSLDMHAENSDKQTEGEGEFTRQRVETVRERVQGIQNMVTYRHRIITFLSRGGQGQSTIIASLAQSIVKRSSLSVCIVDLDYSAPPGDTARLLGFRDNNYPSLSSWADFPEERRAVGEHVNRMVVNPVTGIYLLPAVSRTGDRELLRDDLVREALITLYRHFNLVLVDASLYMEKESAMAAKVADETYWITSPEVMNVEWLKIYSRFFTKHYCTDSSRMSVIINRALPQSSYKAPDIATFMELPCDLSFPEEIGIRRIWDGTKPLNYSQLSNDYQIQIEKLSQRILPSEVFHKEKTGLLKMWAKSK